MRLIKSKIRKQIRETLKGNTEAGDQVFVSRSIPSQVEDLPAVIIYSNSENVSRFHDSPKDYRRELIVTIECQAAENTDEETEELLEVIAEKIEDLLELDETLGGLSDRLELTGSQYQYESDGQSPIGVLILQYVVRFYTAAIYEGVQCLDDLKVIHIDHKIGHHNESPDAVVDAQDTIEDLNL